MLPAQSHLKAPDPLFVGESRHRALMQLEGAYFRTIEEDRPSLAVVSGISGSGKTRLIQKFFNRLADSQPELRCWPTQFSTFTRGNRGIFWRHNFCHPTLEDLDEVGSLSESRLSRDASLRGRQDFQMVNLNDPEVLMRDL